MNTINLLLELNILISEETTKNLKLDMREAEILQAIKKLTTDEFKAVYAQIREINSQSKYLPNLKDLTRNVTTAKRNLTVAKKKGCWSESYKQRDYNLALEKLNNFSTDYSIVDDANKIIKAEVDALKLTVATTTDAIKMLDKEYDSIRHDWFTRRDTLENAKKLVQLLK
jgi:hypothetical protein